MRKKQKKIIHHRKKTIALIYHYLSKKAQKKYYSREHAIVDADTDNTVRYLNRLLRRHGYGVQIIKLVSRDLSDLKKLKADFVLNLVDSRALEMRIAKILDRLHIPHSGSSFQAIQTSNNKLRSKKLFEKHTLPTPRYAIVHLNTRLHRSLVPTKFPIIVKPAFEHCSIGISTNSIAQNYQQFKKIVKTLRKKYQQTLLVEEFIRGKELQVTVLETPTKTVALPPAEITFKGKIRNKWNIYGFDEKWSKNLPIYKSCQFISPPRKLRPDIDAQIRRDAIRAFYALQFRDYARFDLRFNPALRQWYFLEGNANAGISPGAGDAMTASINAYGMTLDDFVLQVIKNSLR